MMLAMVLSIVFTIIDICAVTGTLKSSLPIGINPFWKLAFVFKLLTDAVILDDFKTALDKLSRYNLSRLEDQLGDDWPSSKNMATHRERASRPPVPPNATAVADGRPRSSESAGPWIAASTGMEVESFHMKSVAGVAPPDKCSSKYTAT